MDICEKHLNKALANLTEDSETMIAKLVKTCGKESGIPLVMGMDSIMAGIDTTGEKEWNNFAQNDYSDSRFNCVLPPVSPGYKS